VLEKESAQTSRVASFLTEVLVTRQVNRKTDFESLYKQCNEQAKYVNESLAEVIQGLRYRLAGTESTVEKAKETARQALHEAQLAKNETNLAKRKTLKDIQIARSNEHVLKLKVEDLGKEIIRLKSELDSVKVGARSDASFFQSIDDDPPSSSSPPSEEQFQSSARVRKVEPQHSTTATTTRKPTIKDCDKLSFEFNKRRSGVTYSTQTATSAHRCKRLCFSEEMCRAWTFVSDSSECLLKRDYGSSVSADCCVSGIKCEG